MEKQQPSGMPTLDDFALWMGELQINLKMAHKQIQRLQKENEELKEKLNDKDEK